MARAISTRCRCPPDRLPNRSVAFCSKFTRASADEILFESTRRHQGVVADSPMATTPWAVTGKLGSISWCCGTYPILLTQRKTPVVRHMPRMPLSSVDLPEPFAPISARAAPGATVRLTFSKMVVAS